MFILCSCAGWCRLSSSRPRPLSFPRQQRLSGEHACRSDTSEKLHRVHWLCSASPCTELGKFLDLSHFRSRRVSLEESHQVSPRSSAVSPGSLTVPCTSEVTCLHTSHGWQDSLLRVESMIANPWSYAARFGFDNFFRCLVLHLGGSAYKAFVSSGKTWVWTFISLSPILAFFMATVFTWLGDSCCLRHALKIVLEAHVRNENILYHMLPNAVAHRRERAKTGPVYAEVG